MEIDVSNKNLIDIELLRYSTYNILIKIIILNKDRLCDLM